MQNEKMGQSSAIINILARRYQLKAIPAAALVAVISAVLFGPLYLFSGSSNLLGADPQVVLWQALYHGVTVGILSLLVYTKAVEMLGQNTIVLVASGAPALTTLLAIPILGEEPTTLTWLGVFCVSAGIAWSACASRNPQSATSR